MRGRKPLPSHLKLIKGTARGALKKTQRAPIEIEASLPMPPDSLCDEAKVEWGRVGQILYNLRLLSEIDTAALAAYCDAFATWQKASKALQKAALADDVWHGLLITTSNGNLIQNPLVGIINKAKADVVHYAAEFGMTPSARSRINAATPDAGQSNKPKNTSEKYFA